MEVTALCVRLLTVLFLLCELDQQVDSLSLRVETNRGQFFQYESITLYCDGLHGSATWKALLKSNDNKPACRITEDSSTRSSCFFKNAYPSDSGEYWCEDGERERSNSINITVTDGSVILESPALPVMERQAVTLRCRNKTASSNLTADFYKDGRLTGSSSTGNMTILSFSRSDEGFYTCRISGAAESPESWLTVGAAQDLSPSSDLKPSTSNTTPWIVITVLLLVLLLVVGLRRHAADHCHRVLLHLSSLTSWSPGSTPSSQSGTATQQTASVEAETDKETYSVVRKNKKKKKDEEEVYRPVYYTLGMDEDQQLEPAGASRTAVSYVASSGNDQPLPEDAFYSMIQQVG